MNRSLLDYADLSSDGLKTERLLVLKFIAWSNIDGILLYSDFLLLNATVLILDWIGMLTITSATIISCNSNFLYCIFMPYDRIHHCQNRL